MKTKFFLIFFFSILSIFPIFVSAEEECIFDNLIVQGKEKMLNCNDKLIEAKELFDISLTPTKLDVKIWSDSKSPNCPFYEIYGPRIAHFNETLHIRAPKICDWHYFAVQINVSKPDYFRIKFMTADEYNKKYKRQSIESDETKSETKTSSEGTKQPSPNIYIDGSQVQISIGNQNIQTIKTTNVNINFIIELISISVTSITLISVAVHFFFFRKKSKKLKRK